jgi:hypothetical protein
VEAHKGGWHTSRDRVALLTMVSRGRALFAVVITLAAAVFAAVAMGQGATTVEVKPSKAGTPRHPQGVAVVVHGSDRSAEPTPRSLDIWLPKGARYNGAKYPACSLARLKRRGLSACPPRSLMGGSSPVSLNDVDVRPRVTAVNGGPAKVYFFVVLTNPARVASPVVGRLTELHSPRWSYRLHAEIPRSLRLVAGIPLSLRAISGRFGKDDWLATTSCPRDHRWRYHVEITYADGQTVASGGAIPCHS